MKTKTIKLSTLIPNPENPRFIKDSKFDKLVKSITEFPKMLEMRPMIVDENNIILGGNMRFKALQHLGHKEIPASWISVRADLTPEEKKEFLIKDNINFGEWDTEELANNWNHELLTDWGADVPQFIPDEPSEPTQPKQEKWFLHVEFDNESDAESMFQELTNKGLKAKIVNDKPFMRTTREK